MAMLGIAMVLLGLAGSTGFIVVALLRVGRVGGPDADAWKLLGVASGFFVFAAVGVIIHG
jgi:hypothetical protein